MARSLHAVARPLAVARVSGRPDPDTLGGITAPFGGVVTFTVAVGDRVRAGDVVAVIEAMKLEAALIAPTAGRVQRLAIPDQSLVEGGDVVLEIR
ncbi:MAG TPA: biotin/lipoyl-containing protein [Flexivirga sp.]|uniref:biotin/lipoyl-containing protein n=1 Tax=Flexivirga sp. TaxID=1962927 RepID=UPI002CF728DC|nr:biotin/lipoyl-containing protein [Flexivirga sp.]HWC23254.1 biotin/lipoyl-containing protein [Flexivirga sp.]